MLVFMSNVSESDIKCKIRANTSIKEVTDCLKERNISVDNNSFEIEIGSFETQIFRIKG